MTSPSRQRTFRSGDDVGGSTVLETKTVTAPHEVIKVACGRCDIAYQCSYSRILAYQMTHPEAEERQWMMRCKNCIAEMAKAYEPPTVPAHLIKHARRKLAPTSGKAKLAVQIIKSGGCTFEEMERLIPLAAKKCQIAVTTAEKFYLRWIVYPYALEMEHRQLQGDL